MFHVRKLKVGSSDPNNSVFSYIFCIFCSINLFMQGIRRYKVFVESTSGKNEDFQVGSLQYSASVFHCLLKINVIDFDRKIRKVH